MNKKEKETEIPKATTTHLMEIISEEEFLKLVHNAVSDVLRLSLFLEDLKSNEKVFNKKLFYAILTVSRDLEDFLDAHGAKNNRRTLPLVSEGVYRLSDIERQGQKPSLYP